MWQGQWQQVQFECGAGVDSDVFPNLSVKKNSHMHIPKSTMYSCATHWGRGEQAVDGWLTRTFVFSLTRLLTHNFVCPKTQSAFSKFRRSPTSFLRILGEGNCGIPISTRPTRKSVRVTSVNDTNNSRGHSVSVRPTIDCDMPSDEGHNSFFSLF